MKSKRYMLLASLMAALTAPAAAAPSKVETLKTFSPSDTVISKDARLDDDKSWLIESKLAQVVRLFEVADPQIEDCLLTYRAMLKSEGLSDQAYLEMWCRFPGKGEYFSRGLQSPITGSNNWASYETPFFLQKGEKPDLIKLNLVFKGSGKVWIKNVELLKGPLPKNRKK